MDYDAAGSLSVVTDSSELQSRRFYDSLGRTLFAVSAWDGTYDPTDNGALPPGNDANQTTGYTYDGSAYQSWDLDAVGNMNSVTDTGGTVNRTHNDQNQLTAIGSNTLAFVNNGNTTTEDYGRTLVYDAGNRLVMVKDVRPCFKIILC